MAGIPIVLAVLIGVGWTREGIIEDEVHNIWVPTQSDFVDDLRYLKKVGKYDSLTTTFVAMAIARDGKNVFTEERLEEIRTRMEYTEKTTVSSIYSYL